MRQKPLRVVTPPTGALCEIPVTMRFMGLSTGLSPHGENVWAPLACLACYHSRPVKPGRAEGRPKAAKAAVKE